MKKKELKLRQLRSLRHDLFGNESVDVHGSLLFKGFWMTQAKVKLPQFKKRASKNMNTHLKI